MLRSNEGQKITIGTILHIAKDKGLDISKYVADLNQTNSLNGWVVEKGSAYTFSMDTILDYFNKKFCFIESYTKFPYVEILKDGILPRSAHQMKELTAHREFRFFNKKNKIVTVPAFSVWQKHRDRKTYKRVVFKDLGAENSGELNLFTGIKFSRKKGNCDVILDFIFESICDHSDLHYQFLISYLAHIFQKPFKKVPTYLIVQGLPGTGKNLFFEKILGRILDDYFIKIDSVDELSTRFNIHLSNKLVIMVDEAEACSEKKTISKIKTLTGSEQGNYEIKNGPVLQLLNPARYILTSNQEDIIPPDRGERRQCIIKNSGKYANNTEYFKKILSELNTTDLLAHFFDYLLNYDFSAVNLHKSTPQYTSRNIDKYFQELGTVAQFWRHLLFQSPARIFENGKGMILTRAYQDYCEYMDHHHLDSKPVEQSCFSRETKRFIPQLPKQSVTLRSKRNERIRRIDPKQVVTSFCYKFDLKGPCDFNDQAFYIKNEVGE